MGSFRLHLRPAGFATWLALIAVLVLALAPTMSRALAFAHGEPTWAEFCTPLGVKLKAVADVGEEAPAVQTGQLETCAYCALSFGAVPLPATAAPQQAPAAAARALPPLFVPAPRALVVWPSAQPRAPPSIS